MSKTKKTILIIVGIVFLVLAVPFIYFAVLCVSPIIGDLMITQKAVEKFGKELQPKTGMIFPADATLVEVHWVKPNFFHKRRVSWRYTSKEPFQLPEDSEVAIVEDYKGEIEGENERFTGLSKRNITGVTEYKLATWDTNGFSFSAEILKMPDQYYLDLTTWIHDFSDLEYSDAYNRLPSQ